jgi:hypothetical protein
MAKEGYKYKCKCVICGTSFEWRHRRATCSHECYLDYRKIVSPPQAEITKKFYTKTKKELESIEVFSKEETTRLLNTEEFFYKKYFGKSKNRTLLKDNIGLYKSLYHHTEFADKEKLHVKNPIPFRLRLIIAAEFSFIVPKDVMCKCGSKIIYNHVTHKFDKKYCPQCFPTPNHKDFFKDKYGKDWKTHYKENCKKYTENGVVLGYKRRGRDIEKYGKVICPCIGNNEKEILDKIEKELSIKIDRNYKVVFEGCILYPDGYCHETNTVYEVYEKFHKYPQQKRKDKIRKKIIKSILNCDFVEIKDGWDDKK